MSNLPDAKPKSKQCQKSTKQLPQINVATTYKLYVNMSSYVTYCLLLSTAQKKLKLCNFYETNTSHQDSGFL